MPSTKRRDLYTVRTGTKGAYRIYETTYTSIFDAFRRARNWTESTTDYWAQVLDSEGRVLRTFNLRAVS
ncbi:MAG TPA: hypothetical protein VIA81_04000 [Acidimicrobiia bacterium]|jgi:hypothetical protein